MSFTIKDGIETLISGSSLTKEQSECVMMDIMSGKANDFQIPAYLTALRIRGETPEIIAGAAVVMRKFASTINPNVDGRLVDTCGTGGDKSGTFNISTLAALVVAGAGITVAKHGNRSVSSNCGSADLLEGLGVNLELTPKEVEKLIDDIGIGFMFAPKFHPAMKYAMPTRRGLGIRTIFNILGPLTNPANATAHVLGVFNKDLVEIIANVMLQLGSEHVYVVYSEPGFDEILPVSKVYIGEVKEGNVSTYILEPKDFGLTGGLSNEIISSLKAKNLEENIKIAIEILANKDHGIRRKIVIINAAYAILASGKADNYKMAIGMAEKSLTEGKTLKKLQDLVEKSGGSIEILNKVLNKTINNPNPDELLEEYKEDQKESKI